MLNELLARLWTGLHCAHKSSNAHFGSQAVNAMWPHRVSQDIKASLLELSNHDKESSTKDSAVNNHAGTTLREDKM
jgi:hypothetical protein